MHNRAEWRWQERRGATRPSSFLSKALYEFDAGQRNGMVQGEGIAFALGSKSRLLRVQNLGMLQSCFHHEDSEKPTSVS